MNNISLSYQKNLLQELRVVLYEENPEAGLTDELLLKAMTVNENLSSLGLTMKPEDVCRLAVSPSLDGFYGRCRELVGEVKAAPMYPDFPKQVMAMDEATFRMHQLIHYFSTYGVEMLFGTQVSKGWLPPVESTEKTEKDTKLLPDKVIELLPESACYTEPMRRILARRSRIESISEKEIIEDALFEVSSEFIRSLEIPFKENILPLFLLITTQDVLPENASEALRHICQHTGDVLRFTEKLLQRQKYHLHTRQKRLIVRLLESYSVADFKANLMYSRIRRERNLVILQHLDYNTYSRSEAHRQAVADLRDDKLKSWQGQVNYLLSEDRDGALAFIAERPGMLLRMVNRLLSLGYSPEALGEALVSKASQLSTQTLITLLGNYEETLESSESHAGRSVRQLSAQHGKAQSLSLNYQDPVLAEYRMALGHARTTHDIRVRCFPMALENAKHFEKKHGKILVSMLHDQGIDLTADLAVIPVTADSTINILLPYVSPKCRYTTGGTYRFTGGSLMNALPQGPTAEQIEYHFQGWKACTLESKKMMGMQVNFSQEMDRIYRERCDAVEAYYEDKLSEAEERTRRSRIHYDNRAEELGEKLDALRAREAQRLEITRSHLDQNLMIFRRTLQAKLAAIDTPVRGNKVFVDARGIALAASKMSAAKGSTGGYLPQGTTWEIPEGARYVRFFVYWNDEDRVDLDLHVNAVKTDGCPIHVGWNASYNNCGIVHSGDITHSDAAEYIDIDMTQPIDYAQLNIHLYSGKDNFSEIQECFVGVMAVDQLGEEVELYSPANCFFTSELKNACDTMYYGILRVQKRQLQYVGAEGEISSIYHRGNFDSDELPLSIQDYLDLLITSQGAEWVGTPEEADVVLTMGKAQGEKEISLMDMNFFMNL